MCCEGEGRDLGFEEANAGGEAGSAGVAENVDLTQIEEKPAAETDVELQNTTSGISHHSSEELELTRRLGTAHDDGRKSRLRRVVKEGWDFKKADTTRRPADPKE